MPQYSSAVLGVLAAPVNIEVLPHWSEDDLLGVGVRLRPYGKSFPKDIMVMGYGDSIEEAIEEAHGLAQANRWEKLDWAARPWAAGKASAVDVLAAPRGRP